MYCDDLSLSLSQIGVNFEQYKKMQILELSDICSQDLDQCQVIVVPFYAVTESK